MGGLLWALLVVLLVFWFLGFAVANLGNIVHLLLVLALMVLLVNWFTGRTRAV